MPLLWALRDAANLTGTRYGCGTGDCGACTVIVDGEAVRSCQLPLSQCTGREITTIEALSRDRSHPAQQAWVAEQVPQCGFCQSGMLMATAFTLFIIPTAYSVFARRTGSPLAITHEMQDWERAEAARKAQPAE